MGVYRWKEGFSCSVKPEVAAARIETIRHRNGGNIAPAELVEDARPKTSPLHPAFEWVDKEAAAKYREDQARRIIRSVEIMNVDPTGEKFREICYVSIADRDSGAAYTATREALAVQESRDVILAAAKAALDAWQRRYGHLVELARIVAAIQDAG